jgi:hypothetical protein
MSEARSRDRKPFRVGDRVRITRPDSAYTGCRGTVADVPGGDDTRTIALGCHIAIDGENGVSRPFLNHELQDIAAVKSRGRNVGASRAVDQAPD